jgi:hypothetical protein
MMPTAYNNMIDIPPQVIPGQLRPASGYQAGSGPTVISAEIAVGSLHAESSLGLRYPEASAANPLAKAPLAHAAMRVCAL